MYATVMCPRSFQASAFEAKSNSAAITGTLFILRWSVAQLLCVPEFHLPLRITYGRTLRVGKGEIGNADNLCRMRRRLCPGEHNSLWECGCVFRLQTRIHAKT